jgi:hypothetical protein
MRNQSCISFQTLVTANSHQEISWRCQLKLMPPQASFLPFFLRLLLSRCKVFSIDQLCQLYLELSFLLFSLELLSFEAKLVVASLLQFGLEL